MRASLGQRPPDAMRGRWIPWAFVAFFGVVFAVNGVLLVVALKTWTGLETTDAYQRGVDFNQTLAAARAQAALGWRVALAFTQEGDRRGRLEVGLEDRFGQTLPGAQVTADLIRPTQAGFDHVVTLERQPGGRYGAGVELPLPGQWEVRVSALQRGQRYQLRARIYLAPGP